MKRRREGWRGEKKWEKKGAGKEISKRMKGVRSGGRRGKGD